MIGIWDKEENKTKINKHRTDTKTWQSQIDSKREKKLHTETKTKIRIQIHTQL